MRGEKREKRRGEGAKGIFCLPWLKPRSAIVTHSYRIIGYRLLGKFAT